MMVEALIRSEIEGKIRSGAWRPGDRIPFEHELVAQYGCARATVGKALSRLVQAGLIERRRKAGTFVARPHGEVGVLTIPDIGSIVAAMDGGYHFKLHRRELRRAAGDDFFSPGAPMVWLEGVHHSAAGPFAYEQRLIALDVVPTAAQTDFAATDPGRWLMGHIPWSEARHRISAVVGAGRVRRLLGLGRYAPCLLLERTTWREAQPVTWVKQYFPGNRYELVASFTSATA